MGGRIWEPETFDEDAQRKRRISWISIAIIDASIVAWGLLALVDPEVLTAGFESRTSGSWQSFAGREPEAGEFVLIAFRLVGALNVAVGFLLVMIAATAFRLGHRWAWWTLLAGNTLAIGAPIVYDRAVGFIGTFEVLEYLALFGVYVALAATWKPRAGSHRSQDGGVRLDVR